MFVHTGCIMKYVFVDILDRNKFVFCSWLSSYSNVPFVVVGGGYFFSEHSILQKKKKKKFCSWVLLCFAAATSIRSSGGKTVHL